MNLGPYWPYIEDISRQRLANNKTSRHIPNDGQLELIGAAGELAARLFYGLSTELGVHFDGGHDFEVGDITVDVKATPMTGGAAYRYLQWPTWKEIKAQIIVMTIINVKQMTGTLVGFATKEQILASFVNKSRATVCYEIPYVKLSACWELQVREDLRKMRLPCSIVGSLICPE